MITLVVFLISLLYVFLVPDKLKYAVSKMSLAGFFIGTCIISCNYDSVGDAYFTILQNSCP